jgi:hypothetical protein
MQDGSRFDLAHVCGAQGLLLGTKRRFWCAVCSKVRPKRQRPSVTASPAGAPRRIVASTHCSILVGVRDVPCHPRGPGGHCLVGPMTSAPTRHDPTEGEKGVESGAPRRPKPTRIALNSRAMHRISKATTRHRWTTEPPGARPEVGRWIAVVSRYYLTLVNGLIGPSRRFEK